MNLKHIAMLNNYNTYKQYYETNKKTIMLPGDELTNILSSWFNIQYSPDCACKSMATKMNLMGPDWCESEEGIKEILAVMRSEYIKRQKEGTINIPWTEFGAKQLIYLACRRARKNK